MIFGRKPRKPVVMISDRPYLVWCGDVYTPHSISAHIKWALVRQGKFFQAERWAREYNHLVEETRFSQINKFHDRALLLAAKYVDLR